MNFLDFDGLSYYTEQLHQTIENKITEQSSTIASKIILHSDEGDVIELELQGQYNMTISDSNSYSAASISEELLTEVLEENVEPESTE